MPQICRAVAESHPDNEVDTKPPRRKQDIQVEKSELRKLGKDIFEGEPELQGTFWRRGIYQEKGKQRHDGMSSNLLGAINNDGIDDETVLSRP